MRYIPYPQKYKIKVFNSIDFSKSMHYNSLAYINDILKFVNALELGPLRQMEAELPGKLMDRIKSLRPEKLPAQVLHTLIAYYAANRLEDSDWVVLPVTNFDCLFGDTNFSRKYLHLLPPQIIQRTNSHGVSRYRVQEEYLP